MVEDDDVDYKAIREQRAHDREEIRSLPDAFSLNIGNDADKLLAILQGRYRTPQLPGEPARITKHENTAGFNSTRSYKTASSNQPSFTAPNRYNTEKYAEIVDQLDKFPFSDDEGQRDKQIQVLSKAIRTALQHMIIQEVANNTKKNVGKYAIAFERKPGGLKAVFNFGDSNISVLATGAFQGDETIMVHKVKGVLKGAVVKIRDENDFEDLSSNFFIQVDD